MNRKELINVLSKKSELNKKQADELLTNVLDSVMEVVKKHGKLQLTNVMTLKTREMPEREGRNPLNGKAVTIPASVRLSCKFGKLFKNAVNKKKAEKPAKAAKAAKASKEEKPAKKTDKKKSKK